MKYIGLFIGFLTVLAFILPGLPAQDEKKKDVEKTEKKEIDKKDPDTKDPDTKDPEKKKKKEKEPEPKKDKLVYSVMFSSKILGLKGDSNRELTNETQVKDDRKMADVASW